MTILSAKQITKLFPGVVSLDAVDFSLERGEVRALVGENGAGKSTLIKVIGGVYTPERGVIDYDGLRRNWASPQATKDAGIHIIYQELVVFPELTVAENIVTDDPPRTRFGLIDWPEIEQRAVDILKLLGASIPPRAMVKDLSVADQQMIEIARALNSEAKVVVFDEPTAVLGGNEVALLFDIIRKLKERGVAMPAGAMLYSPWTDFTLSGASLVENAEADAMFMAGSKITRPWLHLLRRGATVWE